MNTWLAALAIQCLAMGAAAPVWEATQEAVPTLEEVLERYIEAVGGREAIERLTTRVMTGRLVTELPTRQPPVYESNGFVIYAKVPGKYLYVQQSARGTHKDGCDGPACWRWAAGETEFDAHYDPRFAWSADPQNATRMWDYFPDMRMRGEGTLEGRPVYLVDIDDDVSHALYFDAQTGLLVRLGYNREINDYREADGVVVPFSISISRKGGSSTYIVDTIEHNVPIDDSEFAAPIR
ncbi:MAG: hypothetical protein JSW46_03105 [Gemmatimonadota bacterium]|nr:MAG: hypothetical protein JSW46_03105 [Gemmatimonadota bacterium]